MLQNTENIALRGFQILYIYLYYGGGGGGGELPFSRQFQLKNGNFFRA